MNPASRNYGNEASAINTGIQRVTVSTSNNQRGQPKTGQFADTRVENTTDPAGQPRMQATQSHSGTSASDSTRTSNSPNQPNNHLNDILLTGAVGAVMQVGAQAAIDHPSWWGHVTNFWGHIINSCNPGVDGHSVTGAEMEQGCLHGHHAFNPSDDTFTGDCSVM